MVKVKGINKVVSATRRMNPCTYLQICVSKDFEEVFYFEHSGYYVNFQNFGDFYTLFNAFLPKTRKEIYEMIEEEKYYRS